MARGPDRRRRGAGRLRAHPGGEPDARLHDQPRDAVCLDPLAGVVGRRPDRRRGEHRPPLRPPQKGDAADCPRGGGRNPPSADHGHAGRDCQLPADVLHHRHDGPLHAADGLERAGHDADVDGRGLHDHPLDGLPRAQAEVRGRRIGRPRAPRRRRPGGRQAIAAVQDLLSADGPAAALPARRLGVPARHGPADGRRDGAGRRAQRAAEDAPLRQQERAAPRAGFRQGHHPGTHRCRGPRFRGLPGGRAGSGRLHELCRTGVADGFQRPGAALLSPAGRRCGPGADQPGG